jgi:hypothetical protein
MYPPAARCAWSRDSMREWQLIHDTLYADYGALKIGES